MALAPAAAGLHFCRRDLMNWGARMNPVEKSQTPSSVDRLPSQPRATIISDELAKLMELIADACPKDAQISFVFDGRLHAMIDVRTMEEVVAVEMIVPQLAAGLFHSLQRAKAPRHGFGHRITALVAR
jgi:hypothetical protein